MKLLFILSILITSTNYTFAQDTAYQFVINQLFKIDELDQLYRNQLDDIQETFGGDSEELKLLFSKMKIADSLNLIAVESIIEQYGWLGYRTIGDQANTTIFMVIQHADLPAQEKYLPMMRDAVKAGNAKAQDLALLEDRVALLQGKKQLYGSQLSWNMKTNIVFVAPLEDPEHVDGRRAAMGLPPLAEYLAEMEIIWDPEQYKKDLPGIEVEFFERTK